MSLFDDVPPPPEIGRDAPLADRMRPRALSDLLGHQRLLGPQTPLRRSLEAGKLPSLILWGPPGVGKTSLARLLAHIGNHHFVTFSAVSSGVKEIRQAVSDARQRARRGIKTLVFIDEIHRFNKAQQDALLPHVEDGLLTLVGATTENPSFEVNSALLSRCQLLSLERLNDDEIVSLLRRALDDEAGFGGAASADDDVLRVLAVAGQGDARRALNLLELAVTATERESGAVLTEELAEEVIRSSGGFRYDKTGDEHYNVISAFIKAMRASDPDAAVYYLARMIESGEDPMFIARRLVIFASEDVGNADTRGLPLAMAAMNATHAVGLPEARLALSQATLFLATAVKSNSALIAYTRAKEDVDRFGALPTPLHIRNAPTAMMKNLGYGRDYRYPHDDPAGAEEMVYLPDELAGRVYYTPGDKGEEESVGAEVEQRRRRRKQNTAPAGETEE